MKFNKTVADALANKVLQELKEKRAEYLANYEPSKEQAEALKALIVERFELQDHLQKVEQLIRQKAPADRAYNDTIDTFYKKCIIKLGEKSLKALPTHSTLSDDFLIEALDAVNAEELINKVVAKYAI